MSWELSNGLELKANLIFCYHIKKPQDNIQISSKSNILEMLVVFPKMSFLQEIGLEMLKYFRF